MQNARPIIVKQNIRSHKNGLNGIDVFMLKINCGHHDRVASLIDHYHAWSIAHAWQGQTHTPLLMNAPDGVPLYQHFDHDGIANATGSVIAIDCCKEEPWSLVTNAARWPKNRHYIVFAGFCARSEQPTFDSNTITVLYWPDPLIDLMKVNLNLSQPFFYQNKKYDFAYPKPSLFTHVSGTPRYHRQKILEMISPKLAKNSFVFRYAGVDHGMDVCAYDLMNRVVPVEGIFDFFAGLPIKTDHPHRMHARAMSMDTYNLSYFSLNLETYDLPMFVFVTEKTGRSLLSGQPFVVYSSPGHLEHLRSMGFLTYNTLWDESYDNITDNQGRMSAVADLVVRLAEFDWAANKKALEDIAANNRQNLIDWHTFIGKLFVNIDLLIANWMSSQQG